MHDFRRWEEQGTGKTCKHHTERTVGSNPEPSSCLVSNSPLYHHTTIGLSDVRNLAYSSISKYHIFARFSCSEVEVKPEPNIFINELQLCHLTILAKRKKQKLKGELLQNRFSAFCISGLVLFMWLKISALVPTEKAQVHLDFMIWLKPLVRNQQINRHHHTLTVVSLTKTAPLI